MTEEQLKRVKFQLINTAVKKFPGDKERQDAYVWSVINRLRKKT